MKNLDVQVFRSRHGGWHARATWTTPYGQASISTRQTNKKVYGGFGPFTEPGQAAKAIVQEAMRCEREHVT